MVAASKGRGIAPVNAIERDVDGDQPTDRRRVWLVREDALDRTCSTQSSLPRLLGGLLDEQAHLLHDVVVRFRQLDLGVRRDLVAKLPQLRSPSSSNSRVS